MRISGVDTDIFKPHSCRSASTSKAHITGVSIENILKCGQWSSDSTFYKFYCRTLTVMITQKVVNFFTAFCRQLIVHNTFGSLHFKAGVKGLCIQYYLLVLNILICACF